MSGAIDPWGLADELRALRRELAEVRKLVEGGGGDAPALLATGDAARLIGLPTGAALRTAARRHPEIAAARVDRRRWDRARLIAAVTKRRGAR